MEDPHPSPPTGAWAVYATGGRQARRLLLCRRRDGGERGGTIEKAACKGTPYHKMLVSRHRFSLATAAPRPPLVRQPVPD